MSCRGLYEGARGSHTHGCWLGSYEFDKQQQLFSELVKPGSVVYDVGANDGFYTLLASKLVGSGGHVVAFEPQPRNLRCLRAHVRPNSLDNVTVLDMAVAETSGTTPFNSERGSATGAIDEAGDIEGRKSHGVAVHAACIAELVALGYTLQPVEGSSIHHTDELLATWRHQTRSKPVTSGPARPGLKWTLSPQRRATASFCVDR